MSTENTSPTIQKVDSLLTGLVKSILTYVQLAPDEPVIGADPRTEQESPLFPEFAFTSEEVAEIFQWLKQNIVLARFVESNTVAFAINVRGRIFRVDHWDDTHIRFTELDYRKLRETTLDALNYMPQAARTVETQLNFLSQKLYGQNVVRLSTDQKKELLGMVKEALKA